MTASSRARQVVFESAAHLAQQCEGFDHAGGGLGDVGGRTVAGAAPVQRDQALTLNKREAAALVGVSVRTFERLVSARLVRSVRGLPTRYSRQAIEVFVHGHTHSLRQRCA